MTTNDDRKVLAAQIDEFSRKYHGNIATKLEAAVPPIPYKTWRRAARCERISESEFNKIVEYLSENSLGKSSSDMGTYSKDELINYYGIYNLYRPNSVSDKRIEIFPAKFEWNKSRRVATVGMRDHDGFTTEFIVSKPRDDFIFLRGAVDGWSSLYALGRLGQRLIRDSEVVKIMTGICVAMDYTDPSERSLAPVVFPAVLEKLPDTDFSEYREVLNPSPAYERLRELLEISVCDNKSSIETWSRFAMPGKANGGPR